MGHFLKINVGKKLRAIAKLDLTRSFVQNCRYLKKYIYRLETTLKPTIFSPKLWNIFRQMPFKQGCLKKKLKITHETYRKPCLAEEPCKILVDFCTYRPHGHIRTWVLRHYTCSTVSKYLVDQLYTYVALSFEYLYTVAQTDFLLLPLVLGVTWVTSQKAGVFPEDVA